MYNIRKLYVYKIVSVLGNCKNLGLTEKLENWDNKLGFYTEGGHF